MFLSMPRIGALIAIAIGLGTGMPFRAHAEIFKCLDERGRPLYTSEKRDTVGKKCETVVREAVTVVPATKAGAKSPAGFPKESASDRVAAKAKQRETIERELNQEQGMLSDARKKLSEQEAVRSGDEKNYARVLERLKPYQDTVEVHEKNVEALKRELNTLSR